MASPTHLVSTLTTAATASVQDTPHHHCLLHMELHPHPMGSHPPAMKLPVLVMGLHPNPHMRRQVLVMDLQINPLMNLPAPAMFHPNPLITLHLQTMDLHPNPATKPLRPLMFHLHPNPRTLLHLSVLHILQLESMMPILTSTITIIITNNKDPPTLLQMHHSELLTLTELHCTEKVMMLCSMRTITRSRGIRRIKDLFLLRLCNKTLEESHLPAIPASGFQGREAAGI